MNEIGNNEIKKSIQDILKMKNIDGHMLNFSKILVKPNGLSSSSTRELILKRRELQYGQNSTSTAYSSKDSRGLTIRQIFFDEWVNKCIAYGVKRHIVFDSKSLIQTSYEEFMLFATYVEVFYGWRRYIPLNDGPHYVIVNSTYEFQDKDIAYIIQKKMWLLEYVTTHIIDYFPESLYQVPNE